MIGVSEEMILGNKITKIHQSYAQRLICQRKEAQNKYIKELEKQVNHHHLFRKIQDFKSNKGKLKPRRLQKRLNNPNKEQN